MAKRKEQKTARIYYVEKGKTAKEIAALLGVSEVTISRWVKDGGWKAQRTAHVSNPDAQAENIKQLINNLAEQRLDLMKQLTELQKTPKTDPKTINQIRAAIAQTDDGVSKWNKTLENIEKEHKITLAAYIQVMTEIFDALNTQNPKLFMETLDFQEQHLNHVSAQYS